MSSLLNKINEVKAQTLTERLNNLTDKPKKEHKEILYPNWEIAKLRYETGHPKGEYCGISEMANNFSWRKGFQYCFTGFPNFGKTTITLYLMLVMAVTKNWKWLIWSPEMLDSIKGELTANDIYDELAHTFTGKNPDKKYNHQPSIEEYKEAYDFITDHFLVIQPEKKTIEGMLESVERISSVFEFDGFLADPFKSLRHETPMRWDLYLEYVFSEVNDYIKKENKVWVWVAHPNSSEKPFNYDRNGDVVGTKICNQFMLSGGSAWNNSMDYICSIHKPNYHSSYQDPTVEFHALKIRKQNQVGRTGILQDMKFNIQTNRYVFGNNARDPLMSIKNEVVSEKVDVFKQNPSKEFLNEPPPF